MKELLSGQDYDGAKGREEIAVLLIRRVLSKSLLNSLEKHLRMRRNDLQPWTVCVSATVADRSQFLNYILQDLMSTTPTTDYGIMVRIFKSYPKSQCNVTKSLKMEFADAGICSQR